jgi:hypothetical protein
MRRKLIQSSSPSHASACGVTIGELFRFRSVTSFIPNSTRLLTISARPVGVGAASQLWILRGGQSGLLMPIVAMESISLSMPMKS